MKGYQDRIGGCHVGTVPANAKRRKVGRAATQSLPSKVDLRPYLTAVEEQVGNSCVANACAGAYEYLAKRNLGDAGDVSRLFIYYNARYEDDDVDNDDGTSMQSAIEGLKKYGACHEDYWPNEEDAITDEPSSDAYDHAAHFKIAEAEYVETDLNLYRQTLADGYPIAFCLNTFTSFDEATANRGRVPVPKKAEQQREEHGWHAMLCVGYLDKDQMFIVRNSWGKAWGDKGYCYIPYKYVIHPDLNGHDTWIIKAVDDLDFSQNLDNADEGSYFAEDGSIQLFDFYVATDDVEGFATALESFCESYADEEAFYFDYEETEEDGITYCEISNFDMSLDDPAGFLEDLTALCEEWAEDENYDYTVEGFDEETETEPLVLTDFYLYTTNAEKVVAKIDKLCAKHTSNSDYYQYEWEEDEDEYGAYIQFSTFEISPDDEEAFLAALEALCDDVADENGYDWS